MQRWKETTEILERLSHGAASGDCRAAIATVVCTAGSAYRHAGARLLLLHNGDAVGSVSAGCLEADVRDVAQTVMETQRSVLRRYDTRDEDDPIGSLGLGCRGVVDVLVQPVTTAWYWLVLEPLRRRMARAEPVAVVTVVAGGDDDVGRMLVIAWPTPDGEPQRIGGSLGDAVLDAEVLDRLRVEGDARRASLGVVEGRHVFVDVLRPPPHVVICGAGSDAIPLVAYAADVGFQVTVFDHRAGLLDAAWFPRARRCELAVPDDAAVALPPATQTLAVIKTHSLAHDRAWLRRFLALDVPYIGVLGPRARTARLLGELDTGTDGTEARVFGPVGFDLGAEGPQQIAISIVAELLAVVSKRSPQHLSERREAIHG